MTMWLKTVKLLWLAVFHVLAKQTYVYYVFEYENVSLPCEQLGGFNSWFGPPDYSTYAIDMDINRWLHNRHRLSIIKVNRSPPTINLQIYNISIEDAGLYKCRNGKTNFRETLFELRIKLNPCNMTIENETPGHLVFAYVTESLDLKCTVIQGVPKAIIEWKTSNITLASGIQESLTYSFIPERTDHLRNYTCLSGNTNNLTTVARTVQLFLYILPDVEVTLSNSSIIEGKTLKLKCSFKSNHPISKLVWKYREIRRDTTILVSVNSTILILNYIQRNQTGTYICIVTNQAGSAQDEAAITVEYAPDISITYRNMRLARYLICSPKGMPDNYTFYPWEHKSYFDEHIRYIDGDGNGTYKMKKILDDSNRGVYFCRVTNGIPNGNQHIVSQKYTMNVTGKPYFVSSNNAIQRGVLERPTQIVVYVLAVPKVGNVTVSKNNLKEVNATFDDNGLFRTYDMVHGKNISVLASKISINIALTASYDIQLYTITVANDYGSSSYNIAVTLETNEVKSVIPKQRFLLMIIILVVLLVLLLGGGTVKVKQHIDCKQLIPCSTTSDVEGIQAEDTHSYEEIDNAHVHTTLQLTNIIPQIQTYNTDETSMTTNDNSRQFEPGLCLSDVGDLFNSRVSSISTNSSEMSYLFPSRPYIELQHIRNRATSLHEYEHIAQPVERVEKNNILEIINNNEKRVKRSTI